MATSARQLDSWAPGTPPGTERPAQPTTSSSWSSAQLRPTGAVQSASIGEVRELSQVDWLDNHHQAVNSLLMQRGFVPLYPQLIATTGSIKAALMLGQGIGLSRTWLKHERSRNGWFWMSAAEWQDATSLTPREQESARQALVDAGLWEERRTHYPSRLYFRVHLSVVAQALGLTKARRLATAPTPTPVIESSGAADEAPGADAWAWDDSAVSGLMTSAHMFFKPLADLTGSVMAGLLLSQLLQAQRQALRSRQVTEAGLFELQYAPLVDPLLMGQKAVRGARDQLRRAGFMTEQVRGSGPLARVQVGLNLPAIIACLQAQEPSAMARRIKAASPKPGSDRQRAISATGAAGVPAAAAGGQAIAVRRQFQNPAPAQLSLLPADDRVAVEIGSSQNDTSGLKAQLMGALESIDKRATTPGRVDNLSTGAPSRCPFVDRVDALLSTAYTEMYSDIKPPPQARAREDASVVSHPGGWRISEVKAEEKDAPESKSQDQGALEGNASDQCADSVPRLEPVTQADLDQLVAPAGVSRQQALQVVEALPLAMRQVLLDELAGHMASRHKTIDSPIGFLIAMARKAAQGKFISTRAADVKAAREARQEAARREETVCQGGSLAQAEIGAPARNTKVGFSGPSAAARAAQANLQAIRARMEGATGPAPASADGDQALNEVAP